MTVFHLSEEVLLLSLRHRARLTRRQLRHLDTCSVCRSQQQLIQQLFANEPQARNPAAPPWSEVAPQLPHLHRRRRLGWAAPSLALAAIFIVWPRLIWPVSPWGPTVLRTYLAGKPTTLEPMTQRIEGHVTVLTNRRAGWLLLSYDQVTSLPRNKVYEAWWVQGSQHIRAGTFRIRDRNQSIWLHTIRNVADASAIGITIEPAPGSPKPTGSRTFFGKLP